MKKLSLFWMIIFLLVACKEKSDPTIGESMLWESKFAETELAVSGCKPLVWEDYLFIYRDVLDDTIDETALLAFDKNTGEKLWTWREVDWVSGANEIAISFDLMDVYDGILFGIDHNDIFALDPIKGETIWHHELNGTIHFQEGIFDASMYAILSDDDSEKLLSILEIDPHSGNYLTKLEILPFYNDYNIYNGGYRMYFNEQNERCILIGIYHAKKVSNNEYDDKYNLYNYNLDKQEVIFNKELDNASGLSMFYINNDIIYGLGKYYARFDLQSGDLLKEKILEDYVHTDNTYVDFPDAYLKFNSSSRNLQKINLIYGEEVWISAVDGKVGLFPQENQGRLFFGASYGSIYVIRSADGSIIEIIQPPYLEENPNLFFDERFVIDEKGNNLYVSDFEHIFCYDLKN